MSFKTYTTETQSNTIARNMQNTNTYNTSSLLPTEFMERLLALLISLVSLNLCIDKFTNQRLHTK
jgi:hypothetical protein